MGSAQVQNPISKIQGLSLFCQQRERYFILLKQGVVCGLLCLPLCLLSQSNLRTRTVDARLPLQALDTLSIVPPLLSVFEAVSGQALELRYFTLENRQLRIDTAQLRTNCPSCAQLRVSYRVLPFDLGLKVNRIDTAIIRKALNPLNSIEFDYTPYRPQTAPWESGGIHSNGAYTRGLSFGNTQNLVFNSNLNLQLDGKLGNDLELQAALSDNSIPLQPDGTTRQLNEFDRVFIQLKRKNTALSAGDYDLTRPKGYFSNYFKRLQGGMVESRWWDSKGKGQPRDTFSLRGAAAISRGKFARQLIQGQEGNQGPYRLQGAEGERFIIVLAGTEKVFVDGQLLRRGLDDDYVIDYNLGELSFTARRLITKDSRVTVEFEYVVQNYLRSTLAANASWNRRRTQTYFNFYSEQDSRNNGAAQELSPAERRQLALAGDQLRNAYASGIDTLADFDPGRVLYRLADTLVCGQTVPVLVYSTDVEQARYAARFSEVPQGQGNYVLALTAANGRVFRWVAPDPISCQPKGNFEPVVRLIAPELRQLYAVGTAAQPFKGGQVQAELALSNRDLNRFSPLGNGDNMGVGGFVGFKQQWGKPAKATTKTDSSQQQSKRNHWNGLLHANYEYANRHFLPLNPYRPAEFVRDWNTDNTRDTTTEHIVRSGFGLQHLRWGKASYEFGLFRREGVYDGKRHFGQLRLQRAGFDFFAEANLLETAGRVESTRFSRPKFDFSKTFLKKKGQLPSKAVFKAGLYGERERNERRYAQADTLQRTSFWYDLARLYVQSPNPGARWQVGGFVSQRNDYFPLPQSFKGNTIANEVNLNGTWQPAASVVSPPAGKDKPTAGQNAAKPGPKNFNQQLSWNFTYRKLRVLDSALTTQKPQATYLGRIDYNFSAWKNAVYFTSGYELGSGQSPKLEFNYLLVNPGQGQFTWVDRNRDSILQVDEMEIAVFQDQASYVRVAVTTPDYVRTNNVQLNQNLRLEPRSLWRTAPKGWKRGLSRFSTQSTLQINRRTYASAEGISPWNPFHLNIPDSSLVTVNLSSRHVLFVNRANPAWDASVAYGDQRSQVALTTGFERRRNADWLVHGRINLSRQWTLETDALFGNKESDNQAFDTRDFDIESWEAGPKLSWLPGRTFRLSGKLNYQKSRNLLASAEKANQLDWNVELNWNPTSKENAQGFKAATSLRGKLTFADIRYTGQANSAVAYTMLEGLQDGRNFLWSVVLERQLSKSMQLSLNYEGRKTGTNKVVHVGRAQVRAVF